MSVRFDTNVQRFTYLKDDPSPAADREMLRRRVCETRMVKHPRNMMTQIQTLLTQCRQQPITIVFGNLGRQPQLLTYYLDLLLTSSDKVGIASQWPTDSPYHVNTSAGPLDMLILLEPHFGYTVTKPPLVDHVVVFSSHMCILAPQDESHSFILHTSPNHPLAIPTAQRPLHFDTWTPPVFYDTSLDVPSQTHVHLDVTSAKSVHEAYLRLLTGRELLPNRPYSIEMNEVDEYMLQSQLNASKTFVLKRRWSFPHLEAWYWKDFETTPDTPRYFYVTSGNRARKTD